MKKYDFLVFKLEGKRNPLIVNKNEIQCIQPLSENEFKSKIFFKNTPMEEYAVVDEPTNSITARISYR